MPAYKALFFLGKGREPTEKLGQKCEVVDRKGQNPRTLWAHRSPMARLTEIAFPAVYRTKGARVFSLSFLSTQWMFYDSSFFCSSHLSR
jgi:hypothetical protein